MVYSPKMRLECKRLHKERLERARRMRLTRLEIFCFAAMAVIVIAAVMRV